MKRNAKKRAHPSETSQGGSPAKNIAHPSKTGQVGTPAKKIAHPSKSSQGGAPTLKGWKIIADYLAQPQSAIQRWAKEGMPVRREGRSVVADPGELNAWLGKEAHAPAAVRIPASDEDLIADLRRGLMAVQHRKHRSRS